MEAPKLIREVEIPRQRSNGAAVVLVAAMAMFTAVAASAFVVRVRMHSTQCGRRVPQISAAIAPVVVAPVVDPDLQHRDVLPFEVIDVPPATDPFQAALDRGDDESALLAYLEASPGDRELWRDTREAVARGYLALQLDRMSDELENGDCAAVSERLHRVRRLLPDKHIPAEMALCTDQGPRRR